MPPNWSTIAELRAELRGWTMATRKDRPLGVEFAAKFGPHQKKKEEKNKTSQKNLTQKCWGGVRGLWLSFRSAFGQFTLFFLWIFFLSMKLFSFCCCKAILLLRAWGCATAAVAPYTLVACLLARLLCRRRLRRKRDFVAVASSCSSSAIAASTNITFCLSSCSSIWCTFSLIRSFFLILLFLLRM